MAPQETCSRNPSRQHQGGDLGKTRPRAAYATTRRPTASIKRATSGRTSPASDETIRWCSRRSLTSLIRGFVI